MPDVTVGGVLGALAVYAALLALVLCFARFVAPDERRTAVAIAAVWACSVFVANYLLYLAGVMSFLPWVTNALHSFAWIGGCLTIMYLGVREEWPLADSLYPVLTLLGVRLAGRSIPHLVPA